jgi:hypothetical protein
MSDFFGNSGGFNKLQGIGLMLSALNPQSFNSTLGMLEMQQAANRMRREQEQAAQTLLSPIGQTLQRGASMEIPARPGAYRPNMTMGANGPMFNPTQEAGVPARPAMDDDMVRNLTIRAMGGPAKYFATQQAQQAQMTAPQKLSPGEVIQKYNPATGRYETATSAPFKPEEPSSMMRDALALANGDQRRASEFVNRWRTPAQTNINMGGDKAITKVDSDRYNRTVERLDQLNSMQPGIERMLQAIDAGAQTGFGQNWLLPFKQAVEEGFGVKISGTDEQEVLDSIASEIGPRMRPPGSGSSSDKDTNLYLKGFLGLARSEGGNKKVADYYGKIRNRAERVAEIQQELLSEFDKIPIAEERKRIDALGPIFSPDERRELEAASRTRVSPKSPTTPPPQTINVDGISGTFSGRFEGGKPVYLDPNGRPFVED